MKIIKLILIIFLFTAILLPNFVLADGSALNLYFFWGQGCPHCAKEEKLLKQLKEKYPQINIVDFEIYQNRDNGNLLRKIDQELNINVSGVPLLIVGEKNVVGYLNEATTGQEIQRLVEACLQSNCPDIVAPIILRENPATPNPKLPEIKKNGTTISLPFVGQIDIAHFSLPLLTIIIAAFDGFNPCAMWVLIFLITLLLGMKNKKRMWTLGISFIVASGVVYFLFLSAWLNLFLFIGFLFWVRLIIGVAAIGSGIYHLYNYFKNKYECKVVQGERRDWVFTNLKFVTKIPSFWLALVGIIIIAFAVNLIELVCSAGLPAIYTNVLSLSDLANWQYYSYLLLYIIIFMLDDLLVFVLAMVTLQATGASGKYIKYSNLIGGLVILILGILLILKPGWLMFG